MPVTARIARRERLSPAIALPRAAHLRSPRATSGGVARVLSDAGLRPGEVLALYTGNKRALLLADLAAMLMGAIALPLNERFTEPEMRYYLEDSGAALALTDGEGRERLEAAGRDQPALRGIIDIGQVLEAGDAPLPEREIAAADPAFILYSSGTTGRPKAVLHCHDNLAAAVTALRDFWRIGPDDRLLNCLPFFHIHGLSFCST